MLYPQQDAEQSTWSTVKGKHIAFEHIGIAVSEGRRTPFMLELIATVPCEPVSRGELVLLEPVAGIDLESVSADGASVQEWTSDDGEQRGFQLTSKSARWNRQPQVVKMVLAWDPNINDQSIVQTPCAVLPDLLPGVIDLGFPLPADAPVRQPRLYFAEELPPSLQAGGIAMPDRNGRATPELLQTVIFPAEEGFVGVNDLAIGRTSSRFDEASCEAAYEYAWPLLSFISSELALAMPVRPVIMLLDTHRETVFPPVGAYCPLLGDDVGAVLPDSGRPVTAVRFLSQAWLNGGMRLWGENGLELSLALGGALGLRWLQVNDEEGLQAELERLTGEAAGNFEAGDFAKTVKGLQIHLFRGLQSSAVRAQLGALVRNNWGGHVSQDGVIQMLREAGVSVPFVFG